MSTVTRRALISAVPALGIGLVRPWRILAAESVLAIAQSQPQQSTRVEAILEVGGDFKLNDKGQPRTLPMSVVGRVQYTERVLHEDEANHAILAARAYDSAEATLKVERGVSKPTLRADRRLVGISVTPEEVQLYSPSGSLTREELDLISLPANSALIDRLLPGREVRLGDRWQHTNELLAQLLGLDAVSTSEVFSELTSIEEGIARFEMSGPVSGAIHGVATDIQLKCRYKLDTSAGRISWLAMMLEEQRSIGHVGPGADVTSRLQMTIVPVDTPAELNDDAVKNGVWEPSQALADLEFRAPRGGFVLRHDRRWHVMNGAGESVSLRMVERGELVAQCNVSSLAPLAAGKRLPIERFQQDIQQTLGKSFGQFIQASESQNDRGDTMYRIVAAGTVSELPIQWNYYLIANPRGQQVVIAVTVDEEQLPRLGEADLAIAQSVEFFEPQTALSPSLSR